MRTYRCFTLDKTGLIARREDIDAPDDDSALEEGWRRVTSDQHNQAQLAHGLELWFGLTLVFTTRDHMPMLAAGDTPYGTWLSPEWQGLVGSEQQVRCDGWAGDGRGGQVGRLT